MKSALGADFRSRPWPKHALFWTFRARFVTITSARSRFFQQARASSETRASEKLHNKGSRRELGGRRGALSSSRPSPTRGGASAHPADLHRRTSGASWAVLAGSERVIAREVVACERRRRGQTGALQHDIRILLEHVAGLHLCVKRFIKRGQVFGETREAELLDRRRRLRLIGTQRVGGNGGGIKLGLAELDEGQPRRGGARDLDQQRVPMGVAGDLGVATGRG